MATRSSNRSAALTSGNSVNRKISALSDQVFDNTHLKYRFKITQSGTDAPVVVAQINDLGGTVVWTYTNVGIFTGTLAGAFLADTVIAVSGTIDNVNDRVFTLRRGTDNTIVLQTTEADVLTNALLTGEIIELEVINSREG